MNYIKMDRVHHNLLIDIYDTEEKRKNLFFILTKQDKSIRRFDVLIS